MYIGNRLKEIREAKKVSLTDLSQKSGVQLATLSRIENRKMVGTLESHLNIARALGITLNELYSKIEMEEDSKKPEEKKEPAGIFVHSSKSTYEMLTNQVFKKKMMPVLVKIEPGGKTNLEQSAFGAEKFLYVLEGTLEAKIGQESYSLSESNTLYFDASLPHYFSNEGTIPLRALCIVTPVSL